MFHMLFDDTDVQNMLPSVQMCADTCNMYCMHTERDNIIPILNMQINKGQC